MDAPVLVLNSNFVPISRINWKRAVCLWFQQKIEIIAEYEHLVVRSVNTVLRVPSVIRFISTISKRPKRIKFSKYNVFIRDHFQCCYCGENKNGKNLTIDHVTPRVRGGRMEWSNVVSCCRKHNQIKGARTPEEAGLKLLTIPKEPDRLPTFVFFGKIPEDWKKWINISDVFVCDNIDT